MFLFEPYILRFIDGSQSRFRRTFRSKLIQFMGLCMTSIRPCLDHILGIPLKWPVIFFLSR